jgi:hypothetical protein
VITRQQWLAAIAQVLYDSIHANDGGRIRDAQSRKFRINREQVL